MQQCLLSWTPTPRDLHGTWMAGTQMINSHSNILIKNIRILREFLLNVLWWVFKPHEVKFIFRQLKIIYLHFLSFLNTEIAQVAEILPYDIQESVYAAQSIPLAWLLMTWWCNEPGHQQPWYWPNYPGTFGFSTTMVKCSINGLLYQVDNKQATRTKLQ